MHADSGSIGLVACLCAAWCGSCRDYRASFAALARERPQWRFVWVDIEDEADALAPFELDIENFPTLLVARGDELRFLGTLLPHAATLARMLDAAQDGTLVAMAPARPAALIATLREIGAPVG